MTCCQACRDVVKAAQDWHEAYSAISSFTGKEHVARARRLREALAAWEPH